MEKVESAVSATSAAFWISFLLKVNGLNLLKLHAGNVLAYGCILLDVLFTRSELKESLLFAAKKSEKPALDRKKVELLLSKLTTIIYTNTNLCHNYCESLQGNVKLGRNHM